MNIFFSFNGRITRKSFWLQFLGLVALAVAIGLVLLFILPAGFGLRLTQFIMSIGIGYGLIAVVVKRLHDRGKPAMPQTLIFLAPSFINTFMKIFLIDYTVANVAGNEMLEPGFWALVITYASLAAFLWMVIELGFRRGTRGENAYGPDLLTVTQ